MRCTFQIQPLVLWIYFFKKNYTFEGCPLCHFSHLYIRLRRDIQCKVIARTLLEFRIFIRIFILDTPLFFFAELLIFHQHCTQISNYGTILRVYFPFISLYIDRFAGRSPHVVPPWAAPCFSLALTVVTGAYLPVDTSIKVWYYLYPVISSVSTK